MRGESDDPRVQRKLQRFYVCHNLPMSPYDYDRLTARDVDELMVFLSTMFREQKLNSEREQARAKLRGKG